MKQLLGKMREISEAGRNVNDPVGMFNPNPSFQTQLDEPEESPFASSSTSLQQTANDMDRDTSAALSNQDQVKKNNLVKQLFDLLTQLTKAKTPASECYQSGIAKAIMESFDLLEAELSTTGQINKINVEIDDVMQQLQQYAQEPDVQKAFKEVERIRKANYALAEPYKGGASDEKVKRFLELTGKIGGEGEAAPAASPQAQSSTTAPPSTTPSSPGAGKDPAVGALQQDLIAAGAQIKADSIMGPKTKAAMAQFPDVAAKHGYGSSPQSTQPSAPPPNQKPDSTDYPDIPTPASEPTLSPEEEAEIERLNQEVDQQINQLNPPVK